MKTTKWNELKTTKTSPDRLASIESAARVELLEMDLADLRAAAGLTQSEAAERSGLEQGQVSRLEREGGDRKLSTLRRYVESLGGELEVVAVLGNKRIALRGV
jgi:predicted transcriptional regulator